MITEKTEQEKFGANARVAIACLAFFSSMVGLAYASVPLYELFCRVTGFGGTTQVADAATGVVLDQKIKVRFDANTAKNIPWEFRPVDREVEVRIGETTQISYFAQNVASVATAGSATFNVTPPAAGAYFNKMECFCFNETTLEAGESMDMPVVFFVDPDIVNSKEMQNISAITLSYTFFPMDSDGEEVETTRATPLEDQADGASTDIRGNVNG
ncbi:MAG: cytochrome c oxidase assembly protein [Pseudomonadota bacterium]